MYVRVNTRDLVQSNEGKQRYLPNNITQEHENMSEQKHRDAKFIHSY